MVLPRSNAPSLLFARRLLQVEADDDRRAARLPAGRAELLQVRGWELHVDAS